MKCKIVFRLFPDEWIMVWNKLWSFHENQHKWKKNEIEREKIKIGKVITAKNDV